MFRTRWPRICPQGRRLKPFDVPSANGSLGAPFRTIIASGRSMRLSCGLKRCECGAVEGVPPQKAESRQSGAELVTAAPLAFEPCVERYLRERRGSMKVDLCSPGAADPAPAAHQRRFGEQRRLDR